VALMGTALSQAQTDLLAGRFTDIVLMLDGDPAGQAGMQDAAAKLLRRASVHQVVLPSGTQPDQMSKEKISQALGEVSTTEKPFTQSA
jgi:DNA primase